MVKEHKRWSGKEKKMLQSLIKQGLTSDQIAEQMPDRSISSIKNQRQRIGSKTRTAKRWTDEQDAQLKEMVGAKKTAKQIARKLGRTSGAIIVRKSALGIKQRMTFKRTTAPKVENLFATAKKKSVPDTKYREAVANHERIKTLAPSRNDSVMKQLSDAIHSVSTLGLKITVTIARD